MTSCGVPQRTRWAASRALVATLLAATTLGVVGCQSASPRVDRRRFLVDEGGGALILHGTNIESAAKSSPDNLPVNFIEADAAHMANEWGFNFARYLIFWSAIEPEMGVYDDAYLDQVEERLDWFAANGIHVLVDMHQDVYSRRFCCDGAPDWAIHAPWMDYVIDTTLWSFNYFTPEVREAFDNFFSYEDEHRVLQDSYVAMWRHVAERFRDHPAVIGYDIMNEPYMGTGFDVIALSLRRNPDEDSALAQFESGPLSDFYQRVIDGIREADGEHYIFYEPSYGIAGDGGPAFVRELNDPRSGHPRLIYAPHLYSFRLEAAEEYATDDIMFPRWQAQRAVDAERMRAPIVTGEWGLNMGFPGADRFVDELLEMHDDMLIGWAQWSWDPNGGWSFFNLGGMGEPRLQDRPLADRLVRTYPWRVAGEPTALSFDTETAEMRLAFDALSSVEGDTEIFVPSRHYPTGYEVEVVAPDGSFEVRRDDARQRVYVTTNGTGPREIIIRRVTN